MPPSPAAFVREVDGLPVVAPALACLQVADARWTRCAGPGEAQEDRLRALGYQVVRLTWADLADPQRVKAMLEQAFARQHLSR